jgi:hypothetical protein
MALCDGMVENLVRIVRLWANSRGSTDDDFVLLHQRPLKNVAALRCVTAATAGSTAGQRSGGGTIYVKLPLLCI